MTDFISYRQDCSAKNDPSRGSNRPRTIILGLNTYITHVRQISSYLGDYNCSNYEDLCRKCEKHRTQIMDRAVEDEPVPDETWRCFYVSCVRYLTNGLTTTCPYLRQIDVKLRTQLRRKMLCFYPPSLLN